MRNVSILLIFVVSITSAVSAGDKVSEANTAALQWLSHLDAGQYETTWNDAARGFRDRITLQHWEETASSKREPFGKLLERSLRNSEFVTNPAGAPDGEYVKLQYKSGSENKYRVIETVTQMFEDGVWRVSGYYVYAVPPCPENLWESGNKDRVLSLFQALDLRSMQVHPQSKCLPETFSTVAIGSPLCLFDGQVRVRGADIKMFAEDKTLIEYMYLVAYSAGRHKKLLGILKERYPMVPYSSYPERLKSMPMHEVLTALFKTGSTYIALQKPVEGARGPRHSIVRFTQEKFLDISRRDLNSCR